MTLRDVARRVGIHPATASRALNESTRHLVSAATATRVTEAAREMGYTPNSIARSLKTSRSLTVGVILPDLTNPFYAELAAGAERDVLDDGVAVPIFDGQREQDVESRWREHPSTISTVDTLSTGSRSA